MNCRTNDLLTQNSMYLYKENPDKGINSNGRKLKTLRDNHKIFLINGLINNDITCDSEFTYYRGKLCSQNDICITNNVDSVCNFNIKEKLIQSDHCPCMLSIKVDIYPPLQLVNDCASGVFKYDHYDMNKRLQKPINIKNINVNNLYTDLEQLAREIDIQNNDSINNDKLSDLVTNGIYKYCIKNKQKREIDMSKIPNSETCTSRHYKAIAEANYQCYKYHERENGNSENCMFYRERWLLYHDIANIKENEEFNIKKNSKWYNVKKDPKKLWKLIDWKGKVAEDEPELSHHEVHNFFKNIFQAPKLIEDPVLDESSEELDMYHEMVFTTDKEITMIEIEKACSSIGSGTGLDGIPPAICKFFPPALKEILLRLFNSVFHNNYPKKWYNQLLTPIPKSGHTIVAPKLRGVAIGMMLSRLYDDIIDQRFCNWYQPNPEQAAYRIFQGCVIQLCCLFMLIHFAKCTGTELIVGLMDFEKAFDYLNRVHLINKLITDGIGHKILKAIKNMYLETKYVPKLCSSRIGDEIESKYGVTQGRKSSANIFSYYISDMSDGLKNNNDDFMDPYCLIQLADDTNLIAETITSLNNKFSITFKYAKDNYQRINHKKTKFMHMSDEPSLNDIVLEDGTVINPVNPCEGYSFLGFKLTYSGNIEHIIENNLDSKVNTIVRYYAWLHENNDTPFYIKIQVLYTCLFTSILYSAEAWSNISKHIEEKILKIEREALKQCLGVKTGTTNDLIYIELNKADIIANIKERQKNFYEKVLKFEPEDAVVKSIWNMCKNDERTNSFTNYYEILESGNERRNISIRNNTVTTSDNTMCARYVQLIGMKFASTLYDSNSMDSKRKIKTRWRLSNHKLKIETGRYTKPKTI